MISTRIQTFKKSITVGLSMVALSLTACTTPTYTNTPAVSIKTSMQNMGMAFKAAMESTTMAQFNTQAALFQYNLMNANNSTYNGTLEEQALYRQGMMEMKIGLAELNAAIVKNDLARSKAALSSLLVIRGKYHPLLKKS